jgi:hypothetical protein
MTSEQAAALLYKRIFATEAVALLEAIDLEKYEIYGVEGFVLFPNGNQQASLDLIYDLSQVMNLTNGEKALFLKTFVQNRSGNTAFEVYGGLFK